MGTYGYSDCYQGKALTTILVEFVRVISVTLILSRGFLVGTFGTNFFIILGSHIVESYAFGQFTMKAALTLNL